jgi:hypothetical protein
VLGQEFGNLMKLRNFLAVELGDHHFFRHSPEDVPAWRASIGPRPGG